MRASLPHDGREQNSHNTDCIMAAKCTVYTEPHMIIPKLCVGVCFDVDTILLLTCMRNNQGYLDLFWVWGRLTGNHYISVQSSAYTYFLH